MNDIPINDGKGLYDNAGLCDVLINDLNSLVKELANGHYIQMCALITEMARKLINLRSGITAEKDFMNAKVEEIKRMNDSLVEQITGLPVDKDGVKDGNEN